MLNIKWSEEHARSRFMDFEANFWSYNASNNTRYKERGVQLIQTVPETWYINPTSSALFFFYLWHPMSQIKERESMYVMYVCITFLCENNQMQLLLHKRKRIVYKKKEKCQRQSWGAIVKAGNKNFEIFPRSSEKNIYFIYAYLYACNIQNITHSLLLQFYYSQLLLFP